MASAWVDALMSQAVSANNPDTKIAREFLGSQTKDAELERISSKSKAIDEIATLLIKSKDAGMPPSVVNAYEKLLAEVTG